MIKREDLVLEIQELTHMLRTDEALEELRVGLLAIGINPDTSLLVSFCESEQLKEYGVVIDDKCQVYEYCRDNGDGYSQVFEKWQPLECARFSEFPQVEVALQLIDDGEAP